MIRRRAIDTVRWGARELRRRGLAPGPRLTARPNPVPLDASTQIAWSTGDGSVGQVWVSQDDKPEALFGEGSGGSQTVPWIGDRSTYEFRLYAGTTRARLLDSVTVRRVVRTRPRRRVSFGSLRRLTPIGQHFGADRGVPIDRYYIENFLRGHADDIRGRVLEIGNDYYTWSLGGDRVSTTDVLNLRSGEPGTTIVADLTCADHIPSDTFDCAIVVQTLHLIYDLGAAVRTLHRILKPGGVLLATVPGISQIDQGEWGGCWCWGFTALSARRLFEEHFPAADLAVQAHGNVLAAIGFLYGLAMDELRREELEYRDPLYQVSITLRAVKAARCDAAPGSSDGETR